MKELETLLACESGSVSYNGTSQKENVSRCYPVL